jgi:hypothetical protein
MQRARPLICEPTSRPPTPEMLALTKLNWNALNQGPVTVLGNRDCSGLRGCEPRLRQLY